MSATHGRAGERKYEPVADIARGGMGRVELVVRREGSFARIYAMKRLRPELCEDRVVREMFLEEARIAGLIRHPNVVPVLDVGEDDLGPYLVMDYVEGVPSYLPLVAARDAGQTLPLALCVDIARQAAQGLAAAHELVGAGGQELCVVHRDVSPQNILLGFDGLVRVTDFGVARARDHATDRGDGSIIGKIGYTSPEHVDGRTLDARSDLFSLGVVIHEMLTGRRLYRGSSLADAFHRIRHEPPNDVRAIRPDVPEELAELVGELLAKTPAGRPDSARRVAARLESIGEALRATSDHVSLDAFLAESFEEERARQRALVAAALERTDVEIVLADDGGPTLVSGYAIPPISTVDWESTTLSTETAASQRSESTDPARARVAEHGRVSGRRTLAWATGLAIAAAIAIAILWIGLRLAAPS